MQQRLRVGQDTLSRDLLMAGAGAYSGKQSGSLVSSFAPVLPLRQGARGDDPAGTFATDRITLLYVPSTTAQTVLSQALAPGAMSFTPAPALDGGCAVNDPLCGFSKDMTVLVFDDFGNYDPFTITAVNAGTFDLSVNRSSNSMTTVYPAGSKVVEAVSHTYYLKTDMAGQDVSTDALRRHEQRRRADRRQRRRTEVRLLRRTAAADDDEAARSGRGAAANDLAGAPRSARRVPPARAACSSTTDHRRRRRGSLRSATELRQWCPSPPRSWPTARGARTA